LKYLSSIEGLEAFILANTNPEQSTSKRNCIYKCLGFFFFFDELFRFIFRRICLSASSITHKSWHLAPFFFSNVQRAPTNYTHITFLTSFHFLFFLSLYILIFDILFWWRVEGNRSCIVFPQPHCLKQT
jgi:hypothetical protein